jgi:hypothetical protein
MDLAQIFADIIHRFIPADILPLVIAVVGLAEAGLHFADNRWPGRANTKAGGLILWLVRLAKRWGTPGGIGRTAAGIVNPSSVTARVDDHSTTPSYGGVI